MKNTTAPYSPFKLALLKSARRTMTEAQRLGTTTMSFTNLKTLTRPPSDSLQGAPRGINAPAAYSLLLREACYENADLGRFLLPENDLNRGHPQR